MGKVGSHSNTQFKSNPMPMLTDEEIEECRETLYELVRTICTTHKAHHPQCGNCSKRAMLDFYVIMKGLIPSVEESATHYVRKPKDET